MFHIGPWELALIFLIVLLLFGAKRLPEVARSIGKAVKEFKKAGKDIKDEIDDSKKDSEEEKNEKSG